MSRDLVTRLAATIVLILAVTTAFFVSRAAAGSFLSGLALGASGALSALMLAVVVGGCGYKTVAWWKARWRAAVDMLRSAY